MEEYVRVREKAEIGAETTDQYYANVASLLSEMPEKERLLSGLLWSIERYGDMDHTDDPAPLHMDLAKRIFLVPGALEALRSALS